MKKVIKLVATALVMSSMLLAGCSSKSAGTSAKNDSKKEVKVGFVYIGDVNDGGYTQAHDTGRKYLEKETGVKTIYKESVKEDKAAVEQVVDDLVDQGANVIIGTSFGFQDGILESAKKYPDVKFLHCSGYELNTNMAQYFGRMYQARYLSGIVAGMKTKSNTVGYVGAFPIPEVIRGINAFTLGLRSVNPKATVKVVWTNTWYDPAKEKDAALALIDKGADVIAQHQDSLGPQQAAESKGVFSIGYDTDMSKSAPKSVLTSTTFDWGKYYVKEIKEIQAGNFKSEKYWGGMETGMVDITPLTSLAPEGAQAKVDAAKADIISGKNKVFVGPIKDQTGAVKVAEGTTMKDEDIWNMKWFVEGVDGSIPKN